MVHEDGFWVCRDCGHCGPRHLDVANQAFGTVKTRLRVPYTRNRRFKLKVIGALNGRLFHAVDDRLVAHCRGCTQPEQILEAFKTYPGKRPYIHVIHYANRLLGRGDRIAPADCMRIQTIFEELFFAHARHRFDGPNFPMTHLLHLIAEFFEFGPKTMFVIRFAKKICCPTRTRRYRDMFLQCLRYCIENDKIDPLLFKCRLRKLFDVTSPRSPTPPCAPTRQT